MPSHYYTLSCMKVVLLLYIAFLFMQVSKFLWFTCQSHCFSLYNFLTKFITAMHLSNLWQFIGTHDMVKCETLSPPTEKTISKYTFTAICIECFYIILYCIHAYCVLVLLTTVCCLTTAQPADPVTSYAQYLKYHYTQ